MDLLIVAEPRNEYLHLTDIPITYFTLPPPNKTDGARHPGLVRALCGLDMNQPVVIDQRYDLSWFTTRPADKNDLYKASCPVCVAVPATNEIIDVIRQVYANGR